MTGRSRFEGDPEQLVDPDEVGPPEGWSVDVPDPGRDLERLTELLRDHERHGRGWPSAGEQDVLAEISEEGALTRGNVVVRDGTGVVRAWGSVHDRARGRMLFVHVVDRDLSQGVGRACSDLLVEWAVGQAREVGAARGLEVQQIDTGAFAADQRQRRWLAASRFERVRTWWQMTRPVTADEADLVPSPESWGDRGVTFRLVDPDVESDLRAVHDVIEAAFTDHFNSKPETFDEFLHRIREDPGHRWDHWWLASLDEDARPVGRWSARSPAAARTSPTSASSRPHAGAASPRACCARSSPMPRHAAVTVWGSRWTPPARPGPTTSTSRWGGRRRTSRSRGIGTCQFAPERPVDAVGSEHPDELRAVGDADDRAVVAQQHRQRVS